MSGDSLHHARSMAEGMLCSLLKKKKLLFNGIWKLAKTGCTI